MDASPLIYLAKVDALDVFGTGDTGRHRRISPSRGHRTQAAYRFPEIALIDSAIRRDHIEVVTLGEQEAGVARAFQAEFQDSAAAKPRRWHSRSSEAWPAVLYDRRARRVAQAFGVRVVGIVELLFDRTTDDALLEDRIRRFASLVAMRIEALEELLNR